MKQFKIKKSKAQNFYKELLKFKLIAPVKIDELINFDIINDITSITLDFTNSIVPPKKFLFPQTQTLFKFESEKGENFNIKSPLEEATNEKQIILGIRPCDAKSFTIYDKLFNWDYIDPYYVSKRENTITIGLACINPCYNCFCSSLHSGPFETENIDVMIYPIEEEYIFKVISQKGENLINEIDKSIFEEENEADKKIKEAKESSENKIKRFVKTENVEKHLDEKFDSKIYTELGMRCIGCGICTFLCPTCHCFDIQDEVEGDKGRRVRVWDSCMFSEYTLHASGHNPRPSRKERTRNRINHKYNYFVDRFGIIACVGCGRCVNLCPVNIDIIDVIEKIVSNPKD